MYTIHRFIVQEKIEKYIEEYHYFSSHSKLNIFDLFGS